MKKLIVLICLLAVAATMMPLSAEAKVKRDPGGVPAFFVGCCWGIREGTEWNDGASLHWREWCRLIPIVNIFIGIWDGADCYGGITAHEWAAKNGADWY